MGAHADVADHTALLQFLGVSQDRAFKDGTKILLAVYIVNHAHINIVGVQTLQQVLKGSFGFFDLPGAGILPVLKYGAQMSLKDELLPATLQGKPQMTAGRGLGHENIDIVDAFFLRRVYNGGALLSG